MTFIFFCCIHKGETQEGQIEIDRISQMPKQPSPYQMRDWKQVAINYDRFTYDLNQEGMFLPLLHIKTAGNNYPQREFFSLPSYVGSNNPTSGEAINILPGLVGSTLVGIDKSNQNGYDFTLMAQDFFNKKNGENLYLNSNSTQSGNDWWYDMMPNLFFYQLFELYPNMGGEADEQFISVADQMLRAVQAMGGSSTPWATPFMTYRAWKFASMQATEAGVPEPEAAGVFGWLLYHAYKETGNEEYRIGAEWALEYLNELEGNPSYELQLPYGTYVAAKMNAELRTSYNIEKMVNWSFDKGNLRSWGTIVDTWSGIDVSGLVGESESNTDYAFQLNGIQQAAALVPMVRYDKRFARSIAKWLLNLANANRLFYHAFLPASLQDATDWSSQYDNNQVMGYEALKENFNGLSPYATGDAVKGGWAETNLALYGTSSIGYLGSMISTTEVEKILKIDLLKTDFYNSGTYPTYLYYNSYDVEKVITLFVGNEPVDIYDPLTEVFIFENVTGNVALRLPADQALMPVLIPAGGTITYDQNQMLVNNIVVDFNQHQQTYVDIPRIKALSTSQNIYTEEDSIKAFATIEYSGDERDLDYLWTLNNEHIQGISSQFDTSGLSLGDYVVGLIVSTEGGEADTMSTSFSIVPEIDVAPTIISLEPSAPYGPTSSIILLECISTDDNGGTLHYEWEASGGSIAATDNQAAWTLPDNQGIFEYTVIVTDETNLTTTRTEKLLVKNFEYTQGNLIAYYPLNSNGDDASGNNLHGEIFGAVSTEGYQNASNTGYFFNGSTHFMEVSNDEILNFQDAISISFWMKPTQLFDRESFPISHGSWQNRWKVSIIPDQRVRWTINSTNGIKDLDSKSEIKIDSFLHVVVNYDGEHMLIFLNGKLENYLPLSGDIKKTELPLLLAQALPDEPTYNFRGVLDEVRIYDYAFTPSQVETLFRTGDITSSIEETEKIIGGIHISPNPVKNQLSITIEEELNIDQIRLFDQSGKLMLEQRIFQKAFTLPVYNINSGFYYLQFLSNEKKIDVQKIFKISN